MEEEAIVFPSDVDAKARELEEKFRETLRLLGGYVKNKIKGRGLDIVARVVKYVEHSSAPRLTNFNHEEERVLQEQVFAAIQENVRRAFEEAQRLAVEEAEIARRASEAEFKRQADQEAMKVAVEMAARIAVVEAQKLAEAQEMGQDQDQDTIMIDQEINEQASGRGKEVIVDSTPPSSPVRTVKDSGSPSSAIPPAVQAALDDVKAKISGIKAKMDENGQAANMKMDKMMEFLASRLPKP
ncbi:hypothetical protein QL285_020948 [Trifolium repens]|nr:hypothetical protein QL285_020948 [Trifolium repens]